MTLIERARALGRRALGHDSSGARPAHRDAVPPAGSGRAPVDPASESDPSVGMGTSSDAFPGVVDAQADRVLHRDPPVDVQHLPPTDTDGTPPTDTDGTR